MFAPPPAPSGAPVEVYSQIVLHIWKIVDGKTETVIAITPYSTLECATIGCAALMRHLATCFGGGVEAMLDSLVSKALHVSGPR